jgi:hypothetical protein
MRSMEIRAAAGGLGAFVALALGAATFTQPAIANEGFRTYPTCNTLGFRGQHPPPPRHRCHADDAWGTIFIARHDRNVHYTICIRRPDRSHDCFHDRTYGRGDPDGWWANTQTGTYRFKWRVPGHGVIDRDRLQVLP